MESILKDMSSENPITRREIFEMSFRVNMFCYERGFDTQEFVKDFISSYHSFSLFTTNPTTRKEPLSGETTIPQNKEEE